MVPQYYWPTLKDSPPYHKGSLHYLGFKCFQNFAFDQETNIFWLSFFIKLLLNPFLNLQGFGAPDPVHVNYFYLNPSSVEGYLPYNLNYISNVHVGISPYSRGFKSGRPCNSRPIG
ncbi:115aa long hypothetical protein [Pyrococcus horikoshii OT3]|uniref:Uncharacterized protein n=1 Tax=Pyrococcus horikoshii (strain ATCC 700860 / DSM 12428 / JCM 9974 / NBRC 100139 / OT-3) TaxID=70601 RepID=O58079_PYRHO|nr:115aa long hypothetical protein [Pyrococcus horikoshii OT3]